VCLVEKVAKRVEEEKRKKEVCLVEKVAKRVEDAHEQLYHIHRFLQLV